MLRTLMRLVRSWLSADRIRVSPTDGRLLALRPGRRLLLRQTIYLAGGPVCANPAASAPVTVPLHSDSGVSRLTIQRTDTGTFRSAQLQHPCGRTEEIFDDDVQFLSDGRVEQDGPGIEPSASALS